MSYGLVFAKGVTLAEVNSENFHMKNDYADNLIVTCMEILPIIDNNVSSIKIINGFISRKKLFNEVLDSTKSPTPDQKKHCKGLALELTWKSYSRESALTIAHLLLKELHHEVLKIVIKSDSIAVFRKMAKNKIIQVFPDEVRVVFSD